MFSNFDKKQSAALSATHHGMSMELLKLKAFTRHRIPKSVRDFYYFQRYGRPYGSLAWFF